MAEVFQGVAESLQGFKKAVAIKRILPSLTKNPKFVAMFLDEAKLSLHLQHTNIVQVFDIGCTDESYFLVMEFVNGCNLKALMERLKQRSRRMEIAHAVYIVLECCKGLNYAHTLENPENHEPLSIVHRDISPPNILLSKNGEVKLVDFGLAKANSQIESTDPGVVKGKFSYLSPEAASGLPVDHRADIFAVGIILWEMFTGRRLFYGDTDYQTVELVRQARIPSVAALNPGLEPELEAIVRKALARDPDDRFQHADELGDSLAQYLFSRRMKVTARDIAAIVRDTQSEQSKKRSTVTKGSLIDTLINEEMTRLTSLVPGDSPAMPGKLTEGSISLDPNTFVDTAGWASDFGYEDPEDEVEEPVVILDTPRAPSPAIVELDDDDADADEIDSLQQMLEPDRTGVHKSPNPGSRGVMIALIIAIILAGAVAAGVFMFKDKLFGADEAGEKDK